MWKKRFFLKVILIFLTIILKEEWHIIAFGLFGLNNPFLPTTTLAVNSLFIAKANDILRYPKLMIFYTKTTSAQNNGLRHKRHIMVYYVSFINKSPTMCRFDLRMPFSFNAFSLSIPIMCHILLKIFFATLPFGH